MNKKPQVLLLWVAIASAAACADRNRAEERDANANPGVGTVDTRRPGDEARFVADMLEDGKAEVELGQLAQQKSRNPAVREFGQMMVRDHTKAGEELKSLPAGSAAAHESVEADSDHRRLKERLTELSGAEFDRAYINAMVDEHQEAVRELEGKTDSNNADVKQWATKTLPAVQQHLERAKQLRDSLR